MKSIFKLFDIFKTQKKNTKSVQTTVTLEDVDKMNDIEKTKLYHSISVQYHEFYQKYYENMQDAQKYYSLFINNNLDMKYFEKLLECCNYIFENVEQFKNLELMNNKLTGSTDIVLQNNAFITLAKAYEKLEKYEEAITICQNAIDNGYTDDGTKNGMSGRIKKLKKKIK